MIRRKSGDETWHRLKEWTKGSKVAERLAAQVLRYEGFKFLDPSHPLGGPDQGKDIICYKDEKAFLIAVSFSKNQLNWSRIKKKFDSDFGKISGQDGFVFFINQEVTVKKREKLNELAENVEVEIYHLERISQVLNSPSCYGIRLEFLDIEMTKEEQISFINSRDSILHDINEGIEIVIQESQSNSIPTEELREFQSILNQITGFSPASHIHGDGEGYVSKLRVPLKDLKEFQNILHSLAGYGFHTSAILNYPINRLDVPLDGIKEFKEILTSIVGPGIMGITNSIAFKKYPIDKLRVPLQQLKEYEETLDRILEKKNKIE
ncbi:MAG TPA: hypothetical protein VF181_00935 [Balneolaceae bacterium]